MRTLALIALLCLLPFSCGDDSAPLDQGAEVVDAGAD